MLYLLVHCESTYLLTQKASKINKQFFSNQVHVLVSHTVCLLIGKAYRIKLTGLSAPEQNV